MGLVEEEDGHGDNDDDDDDDGDSDFRGWCAHGIPTMVVRMVILIMTMMIMLNELSSSMLWSRNSWD